MILRKTPLRDVDLDEVERQLRAFEPLSTKTSALGAGKYPPTEYARSVGGKNPRNAKSGRENPRDPPAPASSVHSRQRSTKGSAEKINIDKIKIDDVERQLREVASSALRKATPPPEKSGGVAGDEQPGGTLRLRINTDAKTAAAGATSHLGLMKASWRPVILQTYGERSVAWRCARSLALPLLILSLGAGTLVVLSPEMALTSIDQLLEDAHVRQVARDERKPSEGMVLTGASFDQPRRSTMLAEPSVQAMVSSVGAPGGEAGPTQLPASSGGPSSSAISPPDTSTFKVHDTPEVAPVRVADDDHRQSPLTRSSPSPTKPLLDAGAAPAAAPSAQAEIVEASESPNVVIAARSDALPEAVASKAPRPARAVLATPKTSISPPTATRSPTTDAAASSSFSGSSNGSSSGSIGDPVSEAPARIAADLATPQAPISVPKAIPSPAADAATSSSFAIESEGSNPDSNGDAPASVLAALATPAAATSVPGPAPSPKPEEAALPSLAAQSFEPKSASNSDPVSEAPASVVAGLATPQASISLATVTPSSTPPAAAPLSGAPERVDSRANSTDDAVSQVPSSAMAGFTALQASTSLAPAAVSPRPDRAASSEPGENVASDELIPSRPRASGEIAFDAATPSAMQEAPASLPSTPAALPNTLAQASPASPIERSKPPVAQLVVPQKESGAAGAALPLPVSLNAAPADAVIVIHGLAAGSTLTVGRALEMGGWQLTAGELHDAVLRPPQGFSGVMELGLELRLPNDSIADRKTLHLEWTATAGSQGTTPAFVVRHLGTDEVAVLLKRGEGFIASGDFASARLVLQRAAEAGDAQAALSLAGTFDPIVLDKLGLQGQKADIDKARTWYQRAQELGSAAAPRRLQLLAVYDQ